MAIGAAEFADRPKDYHALRRGQLDGIAGTESVHDPAGQPHRLGAQHILGRIGRHGPGGIQVRAARIDPVTVGIRKPAVDVNQVAVGVLEQNQRLNDEADA